MIPSRIFILLLFQSALAVSIPPTISQFSLSPEPFQFPDTQSIVGEIYSSPDLDSCSTKTTAIENDGASAVYLGGFTHSKLLVAKYSGKDNWNLQTGCYNQETYADSYCTTPPSGDDLGVAFILKAKAPSSQSESYWDENIQWQKYFENYNMVSALSFARTLTMWPKETDGITPKPNEIKSSYLAAVLKSKCYHLRKHLIVMIDTSTGEVKQAAPYDVSEQVPSLRQLLLINPAGSYSDLYSYRPIVASNCTLSSKCFQINYYTFAQQSATSNWKSYNYPSYDSGTSDTYSLQQMTIDSGEVLNFGPQSLGQINNKVFVGGAIGTNLCPILIKLSTTTTDISNMWAYKMTACGSYGYSVDVLYIENMYSIVYGLGVPRSTSTYSIVKHSQYKLFVTKHYESDPYFPNCNQRRVEVIDVNLDSTSRYYRPLGLSYTHSFDKTLTADTRLTSTNLIAFFAPTESDSVFAKDEIDSTGKIWAVYHLDSIADDALQCDPTSRILQIPAKKVGTSGAASYKRNEYVKVLSSSLSAPMQVKSLAPQGIASTMAVYSVNLQTSKGYRARVVNLGVSDNSLNAQDMTNSATVAVSTNDMTTPVTLTQGSVQQKGYECKSSMTLPDSNLNFGDKLSPNPGYSDDNTFAISSSATSTYKMGNQNDALAYINNRNTQCEITECWLMQADVIKWNDKRKCLSNYSDSTYFQNLNYPKQFTDSSQNWLVRVVDKKYGYVEVNNFPPLEFRIWLCVRCTNGWNTITTSPFMVDVQCSPSSTTISVLPNSELDKSSGNYYKQLIQTYEATLEQDSIYFQFKPFKSSSNACPIVQYKVTVKSVVKGNEQASTLNSLYGIEGGKFIYQQDSYTCSQKNCALRQQPTNNNNSIDFQQYCPFNIAFYTDQLETNQIKPGNCQSQGPYGPYGVISGEQKVFKSDSQILHVMDCTTRYNEVSQCVRPDDQKSYITYSSKYPKSFKEYENGSALRLFVYETKIVQEIHFDLEVLAEGGATYTESNLILNVTCPSYATVTLPNQNDHGYSIQNPKIIYIGAKGSHNQYTFPSFYPSFEQCNFITGYAVSSVLPLEKRPKSNSKSGFSVFKSLKPPDGMVLKKVNCGQRLPCIAQTLEVDTNQERSYKYQIMVETRLSKTTWSEYLYTYFDDEFEIKVVQGSPNKNKVDALRSGFPSESNMQMYKKYLLDEGTNGVIDYIFDHFACYQSTKTLKTCSTYNISSTKTSIEGKVQFNGFTIKEPVFYNNIAKGEQQLKITIPTNILRNSSFGNQIKFFIFGSYNDNSNDIEADGRFAAWSDQMVIDIVCGSETVLASQKMIYREFSEGTPLRTNETWKLNLDFLGFQTSKSQCPITELELLEVIETSNGDTFIPWTNTSEVQLYNQTSPNEAYLQITTYEEQRYSRLKQFAVRAITQGGKSNHVKFKVLIVQQLNNKQVNFAPVLSQNLEVLKLNVSEEELIMNRTKIVEYYSPLPFDLEGDNITLTLLSSLTPTNFINITIFTSNQTFLLRGDTGKITLQDSQILEIKFRLSDNVLVQHFKDYSLTVDVKYLRLNQFYDFLTPISNLQQWTQNKSIDDVELYSPNITITNSTVVYQLTQLLDQSLSFRYLDQDKLPLNPMNNSVKWLNTRIDLLLLKELMLSKNYSIPREFVQETLNTTLVNFKYRQFSNYSIPLSQFDFKYSTLSLEEVLNFIINQNQINQRPKFIEQPTPPDPRPSPMLQQIKMFQNSTIKISFNEPMRFSEQNLSVVDELLNNGSLQLILIQGLNGKERTSKQSQKIIQEIVESQIIDEEEIANKKYLEMMNSLNKKKIQMEKQNQDKLQTIFDSGEQDLLVQIYKVTTNMTIEEFSLYIQSIDLSLYITGRNLQSDQTLQEIRLLQETDFEDSLDFQFQLESLNGSDIWLKVIFNNYLEVSSSLTRDKFQLKINDYSLFISNQTLLPLKQEDFTNFQGKSFQIPPLLPYWEKNLSTDLLDAQRKVELVALVILLGSLVILLIMSVYKRTSIQPVWTMFNSLQLFAHTSLFKANSTPGNLYTSQTVMMQYFNLKETVVNTEVFTNKPPLNRLFEERGYFTTNFIPLHQTIIVMLATCFVVALLVGIAKIVTVYGWRKQLCRRIGVLLPKQQIFKQLMFRIFLLIQLEHQLSIVISLMTFNSFQNEFENSIADGVSISIATGSGIIEIIMILLMMFYIIYYNKWLSDVKVQEKVGHYFVDLNLTARGKVMYHLVFTLRRLAFVSSIMLLNDPLTQIIANILLTFVMAVYLVQNRPFKERFNNAMEISNEFVLLGYLIFQLQIFNTSIDSTTRSQVIGVILIIFRIFVIGMNVMFLTQAVSIQNFIEKAILIAQKYKYKRNQAKMEQDNVFKEEFIDELEGTNFLIGYEIRQTNNVLDKNEKKFELFKQFVTEEQEVEWLKNNGLPVNKVFPNFQERTMKNLFNGIKFRSIQQNETEVEIIRDQNEGITLKEQKIEEQKIEAKKIEEKKHEIQRNDIIQELVEISQIKNVEKEMPEQKTKIQKINAKTKKRNVINYAKNKKGKNQTRNDQIQALTEIVEEDEQITQEKNEVSKISVEEWINNSIEEQKEEEKLEIDNNAKESQYEKEIKKEITSNVINIEVNVQKSLQKGLNDERGMTEGLKFIEQEAILQSIKEEPDEHKVVGKKKKKKKKRNIEKQLDIELHQIGQHLDDERIEL